MYTNDEASKLDLLKSISLGHRVAEEESLELQNYFVETENWRRIYSGEIDIVYGSKGAGKSAIYSLLIAKKDLLLEKNILLVPAENPRGATAFRDLTNEPPISEQQFKVLWKVYFLTLVARQMRDLGIDDGNARKVYAKLETLGVLTPGLSLGRLIKNALMFARNLKLEIKGEVDPASGAPGVSGTLSLNKELKSAATIVDVAELDELLEMVSSILIENDLKVWLLLDRLDVAFADDDALEQNALRALFMAYLDLRGSPGIELKVFLRSDIWQRITAAGFREASHITKFATIKWDASALLNLIVRRLIQSPAVCREYLISPSDLLSDVDKQRDFFYKVFPSQIDTGTRKPTSFDWILSRTSDGSKETAPRELIHLVSKARLLDIERLERGEDEPPERQLISSISLKESLSEVSEVRLTQTVYAENPSSKMLIEALRNEKAEQSTESLSKLWKFTDPIDTARVAEKLVEMGFFEKKGTKDDPRYWVPFMYRTHLKLAQGSAEP